MNYDDDDVIACSPSQGAEIWTNIVSKPSSQTLCRIRLNQYVMPSTTFLLLLRPGITLCLALVSQCPEDAWTWWSDYTIKDVMICF